MDDRLTCRRRRDFPAPGSADEVLGLLDDLAATTAAPWHGDGRVQAAIVLCAPNEPSRSGR